MIWIPIVISLIFVFLAFRRIKVKDDPLAIGALLAGIDSLFQLLWLIPALITWIVYLGLT